MTLPPADTKISEYFTVREAFYLPRWHRLASASDGLTEAHFAAVKRLLTDSIDPIRKLFDCPIVVHVCYRPPEYNRLIGGAKNSAHMAQDGSAAIDFHFVNMGCDYARKLLLNYLERYGLRMEDRVGSGWIHLDNRPVPPGGRRFFLP